MSVYSTYVLTLTPSLYWTLDAGTGVTDQSGNGRNGTGAGGISIGGYSGSPILGETTATDFAGGYISSTYQPFSNGTTRTFLCWVNRDTAATSRIMASDSAGTMGVWGISTGTQFFIDVGHLRNTAMVFEAAWHLLAFVFNESTDALTVYLDGAQADSAALTGAAWDGGNLMVGGPTNVFDGKMAHIAVFESGLTATQILNIYNTGITGTAPTGTSDPVKPSFIHSAGRGQ